MFIGIYQHGFTCEQPQRSRVGLYAPIKRHEALKFLSISIERLVPVINTNTLSGSKSKKAHDCAI